MPGRSRGGWPSRSSGENSSKVAILPHYFSPTGPGAALGVERAGRPAQVECLGLADLEAGVGIAVDTVFDRWQDFAVDSESDRDQLPDFRTVALVVAIERVAHATLLRGIWP